MVDLVDSGTKMLADDEIVQKASINNRSPYSYDQIVNSIKDELQQAGTQFLREGNTLFIVHYDHGRVGTFKALNADTQANYINNSWVFMKACYDIGYDTLVTEFTDPTVATTFYAISKRPPYPDMEYNVQPSAVGWNATIKLGKARGGSL